MHARYLPLLSLLAACAGGAAVNESSPAPATDASTAIMVDSGNAAVDPLGCVEKLLGDSYYKEGGSVQAGFLRFTSPPLRGGLLRRRPGATLVTITRSNGVLYVEGPSDERYGTRSTDLLIRGIRERCNVPVSASPRPAARAY
ncbi:hypothetical protein [Longimicrobium sp.]|uniref:hypothetical protein n=1 Tax=Longimicrobium sp. TaxID=2029185 RepID=UPI002E325E62|nr:hypothetical protein [Longimicrobium sp.]HEX6042436.1 hypothetical protein [Longimicrobium sp.]